MTEGRSARARCEAHGLAYDPSLYDGCVICRRGTESSVPPHVEPGQSGSGHTRSVKLKLLLAAGALLAVNGVLLFLAIDRFEARRELIDFDAPTEPTVDSVVSSLPGIGAGSTKVMLGREGDNKYGYPRDLPNKLVLLALLREKRFDELTAHMESFQDAFEEDFKKEQWPDIAIDAFSIADPALGPLLDAWVESNPESYAPYAARAEHTMATAWHYRGTAWAELTSKKRMEKMGEMLALVPVDATRALQLRPRHMPAHGLILRSERAIGAALERKRAIFQLAVRQCPYCVGIRATYLDSILPRWGGSLPLVEKVAADSQYPDKNPKLRILLGFADYDRCRTVSKNPRKALELCNRALSHGPYGAYLLQKARILTKLERWSEMDDALDQALEILPQNAKYLRFKGWSLIKRGRHDEAIEYSRLAAQIDPVDDHSRKDLENILRKRVRDAYDLEQRGQLDEAIETYTSVTRMHPNYVNDYSYRAGAYDKKGEADLAERDCLRAIEIDPMHFESYKFLDYVLFKQKRLDEIVQHWNRYLTLQPKDANALLERAGTYHHKGEADLALKDLEASCALGNQEACKAERRFR
jgi:tetratricopeptide (TPR) repeat protein